ncbi:hypothetical protein FB45DRAFT_867501 [Roridomyces roridus]|uniref:Uncharacterized protein n=1 Tax=Roridomyces roridus TaxID=1738132 RepID=A0AAD7FMZ8_9AGAR|nr:hypothetical protein FB45DRAFT_867501 [Roridomyces roridus]
MERSLLHIIASSLLTVVLCTFNSIRPSVPPAGTSNWVFFVRHLGLTFLCVIVPELTVTWAFKECLEVASLVTKFQISRAHAFMYHMGSFISSANQEPLARITNTTALQIQQVDVQQIVSQNKAGVGPKLVTIAHVLYALAVFLARYARNLYITHMEIWSLSYVAVAIVLWVLWWPKPADVQYHIALAVPVSETFGASFSTYSSLVKLLIGTKHLNERIPAEPEESHFSSRAFPTCGAPIDIKVVWLANLVAMVLGSVHFLAWDTPFNSKLEEKIWRAATITTTLLPVVFPVAVWFMHGLERRAPPARVLEVLLWVLATVFVGGRLALLTLAFISLAELPAEAFVQMPWARFGI